MTWEYSADPGTSDKDAVRFLIHDTDDTDQQLSDEEIGWLLSENVNIYLAAAAACETRATFFRSEATTKSVGGLSVSYSDRAADWTEQAKLLRAQAGSLDVPTPAWTAGSKAEKELRTEDEDLNLGEFMFGMHTNTGTGAYAG